MKDSSDDEIELIMSRSIIPDPLNELPTWFKKETSMAAANISTFRIKYPLHNPIGPKWYRNYHLIPSTILNPPSSVFSPSFPPMAPSLHDPSQDLPGPTGPSRSPSAATLPTPSSSQLRISESPLKLRTRKTSQDNADLLDASDPWGNRWHHHSPYDTGSNISPLSLDPPEGLSRSRLSSINTTPTRRKTVTPSPLSQSTSALHPQSPDSTLTRKLSKHRKPVLGNLFGGHDKGPYSPHRASTIAVKSQVPSVRRNSTLFPTSNLPNASTPTLSTHSSTTKERRTSVLGRLVRKFSILKKSTQDPGSTISERPEDDLHQVAAPSERRRSFLSKRQPSPEKTSMEKKHSDPSKRIPPPRIDSDTPIHTVNGKESSTELDCETHDHRSSISFDVPFSPGRLTVANPDAPSSGGNTPIRQIMALPPEDTSVQQSVSQSHAADTPQLQPAQRRPDQNATREPLTETSSQPVIPNGKTSPVKRVSPVPTPTPSPSVQQVVTNVRSPPPSAPSSSISPPSLFTSVPAATPELQADFIVASAIASTSDESPLSRASVLVNPPTPYNSNELHPVLPSDTPTIQKVPSKAPSRENSLVKKVDGEVRVVKSNSTTSRKTETFRLMRNPSDKVSSSGETITAEGEHWTVVNSSDAPRRRRTKDKAEKNEKLSSRSSAKVRENKREQQRLEKAAQEVAEHQRRATSQGRTKRTKVQVVDSASRPSRARSFDNTPRSSLVQPMVFTLQAEPPRHRKSDDWPRGPHHQQGHSKPIRPGPTPVSSIAHVERLPSATRPTSEMTSAADMNALRAREAWEMDRLWKGRSMYQGHPESNVITSPTSTRDSRHVNGEFIVDGPGHGSSNTSYLVQPLQAHPMPASVFYANMPSAPPPIIYTATSPYGQVLHQAATYRSLPNSFAFPSTESPPTDSPTRPNPLPRPPRQSSYQPAQLPVLADRGSGTASDYWSNNKYPPVPSY